MNLEIANNFCQITAIRTKVCFERCKKSKEEQSCLDTCSTKIVSGERRLAELLRQGEKEGKE